MPKVTASARDASACCS